MKARGVRIAVALGLTAVAVGLCISLASSHKEETILSDGRVQLRLNEVLTNAMSDTSSLAAMDSRVENYMRQWGLRGASIAIVRNDSLVYAKGYHRLPLSEESPGHLLLQHAVCVPPQGLCIP